jgi:pimeloyl-ACP methyl ester carboxylesterase
VSLNETAILENTVTSADGTAIGYNQIGQGPGLVVVPGSLRSADDYTKLATSLAETFTVYLVDRRGRGKSGPQKSGHSLRAECEDVTAVLRNTKSKLLFGHSFGGVVSLEVALTGYPLDGLALYEPALSLDDAITADGLQAIADALQRNRPGSALLQALRLIGDTSEQIPLFLRIALRMPPLARLIFDSPTGRRLYGSCKPPSRKVGFLAKPARTSRSIRTSPPRRS